VLGNHLRLRLDDFREAMLQRLGDRTVVLPPAGEQQ
jgi:hypothetical protein